VAAAVAVGLPLGEGGRRDVVVAVAVAPSDARHVRADLVRLRLLAGGRRGGASAAANLAAPAPVGTMPRHHRRRREVGLLDLRAAVPIARRRGRYLSSTRGGEVEDRIGFGPHPPRRPLYMRAFGDFGPRPGSVFGQITDAGSSLAKKTDETPYQI
jgi:hypothetical protein